MTQNQRMPIIDGHNDMLLRYFREEGYDFLQRTDEGHLDYHRAREAGWAGGFFAVFCSNPPKPGEEEAVRDFSKHATEDGFAFPPIDPITHDYALGQAVAVTAQLFRIEARSDGAFKVVRTVDELEALRLADFLELTQEEVAQKMQVSRPTVTRMLARAHRAVAEALVHGKAICIQGGDYRLGTQDRCRTCGQPWNVQGWDTPLEVCTNCQEQEGGPEKS